MPSSPSSGGVEDSWRGFLADEEEAVEDFSDVLLVAVEEGVFAVGGGTEEAAGAEGAGEACL